MAAGLLAACGSCPPRPAPAPDVVDGDLPVESVDERAEVEELLLALSRAASPDDERAAARKLVDHLERSRRDARPGPGLVVTLRDHPDDPLGKGALAELAAGSPPEVLHVSCPWFPPRTPWIELRAKTPETLLILAEGVPLP